MNKKKLWILILIPLTFLLVLLVKNNTFIAEYVFARGIYRVYAFIMGNLTGWIPVSIMELGIIILPLVAIFIIVRWIVGIVKNKGKRMSRFINGMVNVLCLGSIILFWSTCFSGVNNYRYTFAELTGLEVRDSSKEELNELCLWLAERASEVRRQITSVDENGVMKSSYDSFRDMTKEARRLYGKLGETYEVFDYPCWNSKAIIFSHLMSYTDIVGVYCVFTMETNINVDVSDYSIPSTIMHELSHSYGFMREDEANFISFLGCIQSESLEFQYSGYMHALIHAGNKLAGIDMDLYTELHKTYDPGVRLDLNANSAYWDQFEDTVIQEVSNVVNDTYLKANNQSDGVASYGRMVDLLLAWYRAQK